MQKYGYYSNTLHYTIPLEASKEIKEKWTEDLEPKVFPSGTGGLHISNLSWKWLYQVWSKSLIQGTHGMEGDIIKLPKSNDGTQATQKECNPW